MKTVQTNEKAALSMDECAAKAEQIMARVARLRAFCSVLLTFHTEADADPASRTRVALQRFSLEEHITDLEVQAAQLLVPSILVPLSDTESARKVWCEALDLHVSEALAAEARSPAVVSSSCPFETKS